MKVEITCENCGKVFLRAQKEINRSKKRNRKQFCSRSCCGHYVIKNIPIDKRGYNYKNIKLYACNRRDQHSPFRRHLKNVRNRDKDFTITLEDLKQQWDKQKGICPYTGWRMKNAVTTKEKLEHIPEKASLDRIDSNKGYTPDNIEFICLIAQYAKNVWKKEDVIKFCNTVTNNQQQEIL